MALPEQRLSEEARITACLVAAMSTPDGVLLLETARFLMRVSDRIARTNEELSLELFAQRVKIEKHLGILWDWRTGIGVPRPDGRKAHD